MKAKKELQPLILLVIVCITSLLIFRLYFFEASNLKPGIIFMTEKGEIMGRLVFNFKNWFIDILHFNSLRNENKKTRKENIYLINQLQQFKEIQEENSLLKKVLDIKKETGWTLESAKVILMDPSGLSGSFWIDKGFNSGLKPGMNVILEDKVLVGKLKECYENYCYGESIFSPEIKISVENLRSLDIAVAERQKWGDFRLKLVPYKSDIQIGDILITSSENSDFIRGLLVAKIKKAVHSSAADLFKEFILEPFLDPSRLSSVLVITDIIPSQLVK